MAVIIGAGTLVEFGDASCVISVSWGFTPNTQRAYCLGSWVPYAAAEISRPQENVSLTVYAGTTESVSVLPSTSCVTPPGMYISISPAACGEALTTLTGDDWLVNSYSYSKEDGAQPGQESWSFIRNVTGGNPAVVLPTAMLRGISEGQTSDQEMTGIILESVSSNSSSGSVSSGGFGKLWILEHGTVVSVGGSRNVSGETGQGSASMNYTPIYL